MRLAHLKHIFVDAPLSQLQMGVTREKVLVKVNNPSSLNIAPQLADEKAPQCECHEGAVGYFISWTKLNMFFHLSCDAEADGAPASDITDYMVPQVPKCPIVFFHK